MKKLISLLFTVIVIIGIAAAPLNYTAAPVLAKESPDSARWELAVDLVPEVADNQEKKDALIDPFKSEGVEASVEDNQLRLKGQTSLEQMRSDIFDTGAGGMDFLGGVVEMTIYLADGAALTLKLESRITAGYAWEVQADSNVKSDAGVENTFEPRYTGYGAPSIQTIVLESNNSGDGVVRLIYRRSFEPDEPVHARMSLWLPTATTEIEISDPSPAYLGDEILSSQTPESAPLKDLELKEVLPSSWDWRTKGVVPAVRDQGSCGSCWAFGTVGIMESAMKKAGASLTDLSEQFLVSCNNDGWSCNGGLTAHKYHYNTLGKNQTVIGAVLESAKPYTESNGTCSVALSHPYKLSGWKFVTGSEWTMPTVDQIKNAIYTYGPITAGVYVGTAFQNYTGGVFSTSEGGSSTNHQIILVGWNDATQSWILRNSWDDSWGENGYMRIKYGTSRVGEGTSWVTYAAQPVGPAVPKAYTPKGGIYDTKPTYTWQMVSGADGYTLQVYDPAKKKYPVSIAVGQKYCSTSTNRCSYTPQTTLSYKAYQWHVRSYNKNGNSAYSDYLNFTVLQKLPPAVPEAFRPLADTYTIKPTYSWTRISNADGYTLHVYDPVKGNYPVSIAVSQAYCSTTTNRCSYTPDVTLKYERTYQWNVRAYNKNGNSAYTTYRNFTIKKGINSKFDGSASGWSVRPGAPWYFVNDSYWYTAGITDKWSSVSYGYYFKNFTYKAYMKRTEKGTTGFWSSGLIVRGTPTFTTSNDWQNSYQFLYKQNGIFSVWKTVSGYPTALKYWTTSTAIKKNDWNILQVTMDGTNIRYYINNILVWSGSDSSFSKGHVGIIMYGGDSEKLYVDWATLTMSDYYNANSKGDVVMDFDAVEIPGEDSVKE